MSFSSDQAFSLCSGVIITEIDGESVLLDSASGQYFGLNDTGTQILNLIKNQQHYSKICEKLTSKYPNNDSNINEDVCELITQMLDKQLIRRL